jgi:hypothetical protein
MKGVAAGARGRAGSPPRIEGVSAAAWHAPTGGYLRFARPRALPWKLTKHVPLPSLPSFAKRRSGQIRRRTSAKEELRRVGRLGEESDAGLTVGRGIGPKACGPGADMKASPKRGRRRGWLGLILVTEAERTRETTRE